MEDLIENVRSLEIGSAATGMKEAAGIEHPFLIEHQSDSPMTLFDGFMTIAAFGLATGRPFSSVDARKATVCDGAMRDRFKRFPIRSDFGHLCQHL